MEEWSELDNSMCGAWCGWSSEPSSDESYGALPTTEMEVAKLGERADLLERDMRKMVEINRVLIEQQKVNDANNQKLYAMYLDAKKNEEVAQHYAKSVNGMLAKHERRIAELEKLEKKETRGRKRKATSEILEEVKIAKIKK